MQRIDEVFHDIHVLIFPNEGPRRPSICHASGSNNIIERLFAIVIEAEDGRSKKSRQKSIRVLVRVICVDHMSDPVLDHNEGPFSTGDKGQL
jgi:hypothetical protein